MLAPLKVEGLDGRRVSVPLHPYSKDRGARVRFLCRYCFDTGIFTPGKDHPSGPVRTWSAPGSTEPEPCRACAEGAPRCKGCGAGINPYHPEGRYSAKFTCSTPVEAGRFHKCQVERANLVASRKQQLRYEWEESQYGVGKNKRRDFYQWALERVLHEAVIPHLTDLAEPEA